MFKNKFYENIKETLKKLMPFKPTNQKYREKPKDVDAERHPEEQIYPDLFKKKDDFKKRGHINHTRTN